MRKNSDKVLPPHLATGIEAERLAGKYLRRQGLTTVYRNYRSRYGEIDLVLQDGDTMVFVEVRFRNNIRYGTAAESITREKTEKIRKTAQFFLQDNHRYAHLYSRFDVVAVSSSGDQPEITWIKDAF
jgi:putative endonuclease